MVGNMCLYVMFSKFIIYKQSLDIYLRKWKRLYWDIMFLVILMAELAKNEFDSPKHLQRHVWERALLAEVSYKPVLAGGPLQRIIFLRL